MATDPALFWTKEDEAQWWGTTSLSLPNREWWWSEAPGLVAADWWSSGGAAWSTSTDWMEEKVQYSEVTTASSLPPGFWLPLPHQQCLGKHEKESTVAVTSARQEEAASVSWLPAGPSNAENDGHWSRRQWERRQPPNFLPAICRREEVCSSDLHGVDLGVPGEWPDELLLMRLDSAEVPEARQYALLATLLADDHDRRSLPFFGHSLGYSLTFDHCHDGAAAPFTVRITPEVINWAAVWKSAKQRRDLDAEEIIGDFHEATLLNLLPKCFQAARQALQRRPTTALLVRLRGDCVDSTSSTAAGLFDFEFMRAEFEELRKMEIARMRSIIAEDEYEGDDNNTTSEAKSSPQRMWLVPLLRRFFYLRDLEDASMKYDPIFPPLAPDALADILAPPNTAGLAVDAPFEKYQILGHSVLRLLTAVLADDHRDRAENWTVRRERLAALMRGAFPAAYLSAAMSFGGDDHQALPGVRWEGPASSTFSESTAEELARAGEAFLGAYFMSSGGGLLSCWLFLDWLQRRRPDGGDGQLVANMTPAAAYFLFGGQEPFRGRTPTYVEFHEVDAPDEKILVVLYEEVLRGVTYQEVRRYRRANSERKCPEEKLHDSEEWLPLAWSYNNDTFRGAASLLSHEHFFVPNKVRSWLMWCPVAALVNSRHCLSRDEQADGAPPTLNHVQLQVRKSGELGVCYKCDDDAAVWFVYAPSAGGNLGAEWKEQNGRESARPLIFSERDKAIVSPELARPLGRRIAAIVLASRNMLASISPDYTTKESVRAEQYSSLVANEQEGRSIVWRFTHGGHSWTLRASIATTDCGCYTVCVETDEDSGDSQELIYSEELRTWLSPALTKAFSGAGEALEQGHQRPPSDEQRLLWSRGVPIPPTILRLILQPKHHRVTPEHLMEQQRNEPWRIASDFKNGAGLLCTYAARLEKDVLKYTFRNPALIVEAMTHASYREARTPSNERLAGIGKHVIEMLLARAVIERQAGTTTAVFATQDEGWGRKLHQVVPSRDAHDDGAKKGSPLSSLNFDHTIYADLCIKTGVSGCLLHNTSLELGLGIQALGDAFLALAAAVFFDCGWLHFSRVFLLAEESPVAKHLAALLLNVSVSEEEVVPNEGWEERILLAADKFARDDCSISLDGIIRCALCDVRCNGESQYKDHLIGKKHLKNALKKQAAPLGDAIWQ